MLTHWKNCRIELGNEGFAGRTLDGESWKRVIDLLHKYSVKNVTFTGWHQDIVSLVEYCEQKRIDAKVELPVGKLGYMSYNAVIKNTVCKIGLDEDDGKNLLGEIPEDGIIEIPSTILIRVGKKNIERLIPLLEKLSKCDEIKAVRLEVIHHCYVCYDSFWQTRTSKNDEERFKAKDSTDLSKIIRAVKARKKEFKIINSNRYLDGIYSFGITQNWKCKYWDFITIAPDGCLMVCRDRHLVSPMSIFEITDRKKERFVTTLSIATSKYCKGCYWEEKVESEYRITERGDD